jgi:hypothetical protein
MATRTVWTGKASDLLGALTTVVDERAVKAKTWPDGPRALAGRLRRAATFLRKIGVEIAFQKEKSRARTRTITITTMQPSAASEKPGAEPSEPSASSVDPGKANAVSGFSAQSARTQIRDADANPLDADGSGQRHDQTVRANPSENNAADDADGADANCPAHSAPEKMSTPVWRARL